MKVQNGDREFEVGYFLFLPNGISERGDLEALLNAGQFSVFERNGDGSKLLPAFLVEGSYDRQAQALKVRVTGEDAVEALFSERRRSVIMQTESAAGPFTQRTTVTYRQ